MTIREICKEHNIQCENANIYVAGQKIEDPDVHLHTLTENETVEIVILAQRSGHFIRVKNEEDEP